MLSCCYSSARKVFAATVGRRKPREQSDAPEKLTGNFVPFFWHFRRSTRRVSDFFIQSKDNAYTRESSDNFPASLRQWEHVMLPSNFGEENRRLNEFPATNQLEMGTKTSNMWLGFESFRKLSILVVKLPDPFVQCGFHYNFVEFLNQL